ncbi:hypothetical protein [Stenotrophomonas indicatrix]|uniref:hypothetical protein n=1 Tax=Stenotrophomonas indicatrix TaxID=2045451 RepID=UPI001AA109F9|nr:hypothetical protein [Stenotrophomonas indicatrix]MBO1748943.1 hypothetical protein [Stenotrophomonas indicatrix]
MGVDNKLLMDAVAAINARFSSGNSVPVDRAWVSYAEWKNLQYALALALTPPEEPDQALLVSMAMLVYHGFGLLTPEQKQFQLREMRKLWDEVMGRGYYSPDNRERYAAMLAARPEVKP